MRYLSICSGIEAATVAWHPLGWSPHAFAEIDAFPSAVLSHHYGSNAPGEAWSHNAPPNFGDMRNFKDWPDADISLLVGGTPCQSFSVAGLRKGLADPRGNLCLTFLAIADKYRPQWVLWENVPGVLSNNGGRDFGAFLGGLGQLGYGWGYRVLDAQYVRVDGFARAVPQRRRRVFVVGYLGDWRCAAAVLFERESLCGNSAPRRQAGQGIAGALGAVSPGGGWRLGADEAAAGQLVANSLLAKGNSSHDESQETYIAHALNARGGSGRSDFESETLVAHSLRADGFDASEDGTGRGTPLAIAFQTSQSGMREVDAHATLDANNGSRRHNGVAIGNAVRRLTPRECERLQGFEDDYTLIPYRGKLAADGPRYKAIGNSMAVNCMRWLGTRIALVEQLCQEAA